MLHRITIIITLLSCVLISAQHADNLPNIIIFIADDVSYEDFGCTGNMDVKTPNIDTLGESGLNFSNFYLTASSCSPSRISIITGRYPHNTGAAELHSEPPLGMRFFPEDLQKKGYYTIQAGKWHMGESGKKAFNDVNINQLLNGPGGENQWTELIEKAPIDKPYFAWFASYDAHRGWGDNEFTGTHTPASIRVPDYFADTPNTRNDICNYYDEISRFDFQIGEVVKALEKRNELDNTLIMVMSDNGRPFPHSKTRVNDRGMKSPFIVHWPNGIKNNIGNRDELVSAIDIAPTLLRIAGLEPTMNYQGLSFFEMFNTPDYKTRNYVFAEHNWHDYEAHERMVRNKEYMYILNSRPQLQQSGPLDAVNSETYADLDHLKKENLLNAKQVDIFATPRPFEELYHYESDPDQWKNCAIELHHIQGLNQLRTVLNKWMRLTGDTVPENLTMDWYSKIYNDPNNIIINGKRGEMPGFSTKAIHINQKGPY
jgi:N-sulfoglucosamine sulfohydrolase